MPHGPNLAALVGMGRGPKLGGDGLGLVPASATNKCEQLWWSCAQHVAVSWCTNIIFWGIPVRVRAHGMWGSSWWQCGADCPIMSLLQSAACTSGALGHHFGFVSSQR